MFEHFTAVARDVVGAACTEARRRGDGWIGTEHLLVGLLERGTDSAVLAGHGVDLAGVRARIERHVPSDLDGEALASLGVDLDRVRRAADAAFGPGALALRRPGSGRRPRFSRRAKQVMALAVAEAQRAGDRELRDGHLLLGVLREGGGLAARVLVEAGVDLRAVRTELEARLAGPRAA